jgi:hypothetical protein
MLQCDFIAMSHCDPYGLHVSAGFLSGRRKNHGFGLKRSQLLTDFPGKGVFYTANTDNGHGPVFL